MAFFSDQRPENRRNNEFVKGFPSYEPGYRLFSKAQKILQESLEYQNTENGKQNEYDIFLSDSTKDSKKITGLKLEIEDMSYSVYIDWLMISTLTEAMLRRKQLVF